MSVLAKWEGQDAVTALRAIRAAAVVRSKNVARKELRGVLLTDGVVVASDWYCLIVVPLSYQGPDIFLPSTVLDRLEKIKLTPRVGTCTLEISDSEKTINVRWSDGTTTEVSNAEMEENSFYDWKAVTISPDQYQISSSESVLLSINLFTRIAKVASELGDRNATIELRHVTSSKHATVWSIKTAGYKDGFRDVMWIQMPVRP